MDILQTLKDNWAVIVQAPAAFVTILVVLGGAGFCFGRFWKSEVVANLESRLAMQTHRLEDYKSRLDGKSPDEAAAEIENLKKRLAAIEPRTLSDDEKRLLTAKLTSYRSQINVVHDVASGNFKKFQLEIADLFRRCGWAVNTPSVMGIAFPPPTGISIEGVSTDPAFNCVVEAFQNARIQFDLRPPKVGASGQSLAVSVLITTPV